MRGRVAQGLTHVVSAPDHLAGRIDHNGADGHIAARRRDGRFGQREPHERDIRSLQDRPARRLVHGLAAVRTGHLTA